jgi:hypothetical protein
MGIGAVGALVTSCLGLGVEATIVAALALVAVQGLR